MYTLLCTWKRKDILRPRPSHLQPCPDVGTEELGNTRRPSLHPDVARQPASSPFAQCVCGAPVIRFPARGSRTPPRLRIKVVCDAGRVENLQEEAHLTARQSISPAEVAPFNPIETPPFPRSRINLRRSDFSRIPDRAPSVKLGGVGSGRTCCLGDLRDQRQQHHDAAWCDRRPARNTPDDPPCLRALPRFGGVVSPCA